MLKIALIEFNFISLDFSILFCKIHKFIFKLIVIIEIV